MEDDDDELDGAWDPARGGHFDATARKYAIGASLRILGTYFRKSSEVIADQAGLSSSPDHRETAALLSALRLRAAIAAAHKLIRILRAIEQDPNFRYRTRRTESVGTVRGRLDVVAYSRQVARIADVPRYPIIEVNRNQSTPENVLAFAAAMWIQSELNTQLIRTSIPNAKSESDSADELSFEIERMLMAPLFRVCASEAREVIRRDEIEELGHRVERRLTAGHVANEEPYAELLEWVQQSLEGAPIAEPGDIDWAFYADDFDDKLFEIWCLHLLAERIGTELDIEPTAGPNVVFDDKTPIYEWHVGDKKLDIFFQNGYKTAVPGAKHAWRTDDESKREIRAVPDIMITVRTGPTIHELLIIDPKLRQRTHGPTDELYKIIGYFGNFGLNGNGKGAVLYYAAGTDELRSRNYVTDEGGSLAAIALDPARRQANQDPLEKLIRLATDTITGKNTSLEGKEEIVDSRKA